MVNVFFSSFLFVLRILTLIYTLAISIYVKMEIDTSQISEMNIVLVFTTVIFLPVYAITYFFSAKRTYEFVTKKIRNLNVKCLSTKINNFPI